MEYTDLNSQRRSVNIFDPAVEISEEELKAVFDLAALTPSSFNLQPWKIVIARSAEVKEKLREAAFNQKKVTDAAAVLVLFGNRKQYEECDDVMADWLEKGYLKENEIESTKETARNLYQGDREDGFVSRNVGLLAMNLMLAAEDRGWNTHPMDGFEIEKVQKLFGLDEKYLPVMLIAIGKKPEDFKLFSRARRRSFEEVCEIR